jgi:hypothetical protein
MPTEMAIQERQGRLEEATLAPQVLEQPLARQVQLEGATLAQQVRLARQDRKLTLDRRALKVYQASPAPLDRKPTLARQVREPTLDRRAPRDYRDLPETLDRRGQQEKMVKVPTEMAIQVRRDRRGLEVFLARVQNRAILVRQDQ